MGTPLAFLGSLLPRFPRCLPRRHPGAAVGGDDSTGSRRTWLPCCCLWAEPAPGPSPPPWAGEGPSDHLSGAHLGAQWQQHLGLGCDSWGRPRTTLPPGPGAGVPGCSPSMMVSLADPFQGISLLVFGKSKQSQLCPAQHREIWGQSCRGSCCFPPGFLRNWNRSHPRLSTGWNPGYHRPHSLSRRFPGCPGSRAVWTQRPCSLARDVNTSSARRADPAVWSDPRVQPSGQAHLRGRGRGFEVKT